MLTVDPDTRYQTIEGWGTCLVAWQEPMRKLYRTEDFQRTYAETMGLNLLRVNMWGPTFSGAVDEPSDIRAADYDLDADGGRARIFIDFARGAKAIDPDLKLIGTVWSPPAWMKVNRSIKGTFSGAISGASYDAINKDAAPGQVIDNRVDPRFYPHFVAWVVEYVRLHAEAGVPFYAVSLGNEVMFTQDLRELRLDRRRLRHREHDGARGARRGGVRRRETVRARDHDRAQLGPRPRQRAVRRRAVRGAGYRRSPGRRTATPTASPPTAAPTARPRSAN